MSRWLNETTSQKNLPARISVRMRVRIFSPGWRRIVRFKSGYFSRKRFRSGAASGVFIAVYQTTSRSPPAASAGGAGACARTVPACAKKKSAANRGADLAMGFDMECQSSIGLRTGRAGKIAERGRSSDGRRFSGPPRTPSVHVALVAICLCQFHEETLGGCAVHPALRDGDLLQGEVHVARHALGVPANVKIRAVREPAPKFLRGLEHLVLHVHLARLVAGECEVHAAEHAPHRELFQLGSIEKIRFAAVVAEEQPVTAGGARGRAFLEKGAERGDAGAGADHDDLGGEVGRQAKGVRSLHEHR